MANILGEFVDLVKSAYEADKSAALTAIQAGEGGVEAFALNALQNIKVTGALGVVWPFVQPQLVTAVKALVAKYGPEVVYDLIDALLAEAAKEAGG